MNLRARLHLTAALTLLWACGSGEKVTDADPSTSPSTAPTSAATSTSPATSPSTGATTTSTVVTTTTLPTTRGPTTTVPSASQPFSLVGTVVLDAPAGGADVVMAASDDTVYVASGPEPAVRVGAIDIATGTVRWTATLTESGRFGWSIGATSLGVLVPYGEDSNPDEDAMKLTLLAEDTGQPVWTVDTGWLYEVNDGLNDRVAGLWLGEYEEGLVDLSSGEIMSLGDKEWATGGGDVVVADGTTILKGLDPFDPTSMRRSSVAFPVDELVAAGDVMVLRSKRDLVGMLDGQEVWRHPLPADTWAVPPPDSGPPLIGVMHNDAATGEQALVELLRYDAASVHVLDGVPEAFSANGVAHTTGGDVVFGHIGPWRAGGDNVVLLVGQDLMTLLDSSGISPAPNFQGSFAGYLVDDTGDGFVLRSVPDFVEVARLPLGSQNIANDVAYFVVADDDVTLSIYA